MFPTIKSSNAADEKGMYALLPKRKMRNAQYFFVAYQNQYPVVCVTSVRPKNSPTACPATNFNSLAPTASTPIFPFVPLKSHS